MWGYWGIKRYLAAIRLCCTVCSTCTLHCSASDAMQCSSKLVPWQFKPKHLDIIVKVPGLLSKYNYMGLRCITSICITVAAVQLVRYDAVPNSIRSHCDCGLWLPEPPPAGWLRTTAGRDRGGAGVGEVTPILLGGGSYTRDFFIQSFLSSTFLSDPGQDWGIMLEK